MEDFILLLNKPKNISSFSYIQKIRKEMNLKKIGHAGTLDPMAEGLMIVMANEATKFSDFLMKKNKTYYVEMEFGYETNTLDLEGEIIKKYPDKVILNEEEIIKILNSFIGKIKQIPPMFSAIKKDGVKLYDLARKGITLDLEARDVEIFNIYEIKILNNFLCFKVDVSSGTYIRSLVRDIGEKTKFYATMTKLVREKIDEFSIYDEKKIISIEDLLKYEKFELDEDIYFKLKNGMTVIINNNFSNNNKFLKVYYKNNFVGVVEIINKKENKIYIKRSKYFKNN